MTRRAVLCSRCRKLIGSDESNCSWCGAPRPAAWRQATGRLWGTFDGDGVIKAIITVNIIFYALSLLLSTHGGPSFNPLSMLTPDRTSLLLLGETGTIPIDRFGRYWTILSANYLHGGILHILFNLMALRQIAPWVIQEYGTSRMFVIYTLGGMCGYVVSYLAGVPFTIGASAAICGLIGALLYFGRSRGGVYGSAVYREVGGWVIGLFIFGLLMPGINNWGHGGGIVGGMVVGMLLGYGERRPETAAHRVLALLCALLTAAVLVWAALGAFLLWSR
ncbi:MAG TPA: rhomboid family intramembrane serine protease [Desulfuromonadaceae bacterium]